MGAAVSELPMETRFARLTWAGKSVFNKTSIESVFYTN
jgi:hypothetical protein